MKKLKVLVILVIIGAICFGIYKIYDESKEVDFKIKMTDGLQISVDGKEFKDEISKEDILNLSDSYKDSVNQIPKKLGNVSSPLRVENGKLDMYYVQYVKGNEFLKAFKEDEVNCAIKDECVDKNYIAFDVFIKSDNPVTLNLTKNSNVKSRSGKGNNNYYNATRVGFIVEGTVPADNSDLAQSLSGGNRAIIWEPNYDINKKNEEGFLSYKAVDEEIKKEISAGQVDGNFSFLKVTSNVFTRFENNKDTELLDIQAGITKIRVYMWLESQDIDMKPNASTNKLMFDVELGAKK